MVKNHLKRLKVPRTWSIPRKSRTWITKPNPGPHKIENSLPLNVILRDILKYAKTTKEVKSILNKKDILIDKIPRKDHKIPVGLFDILEIPRINERFIILLDRKGRIHPIKITEKQAEIKYSKIIDKKVLKGNKVQINLYNGNNLISENKDYKVNETLVINLKDKKVLNSLKFEKGAIAYIISGKHAGNSGEIKAIKGRQVEMQTNEKLIRVPREYIFIIDKEIIKNE